MFHIFQRATVYVKSNQNKVEIINLKTGDAIAKTPDEPFSSPRLLIANYNVAEALCKEVIRELGLAKGIAPTNETVRRSLSMSEKRILRDLGEQIGGVAVFIVTDDRHLSNTGALLLTKEVSI